MQETKEYTIKHKKKDHHHRNKSEKVKTNALL